MLSSGTEMVSAPLQQALPRCTDHLSDDETYEVCARGGGEAELNDMLRHSMNKIVRQDGWLVQRERTIPKLISRADLLVVDANGDPVSAIESKMFYATDAVDIPNNYRTSINRDAAKLRRARENAPALPVFLLVWVPYFPEVRRLLRYMKGHVINEGRLVSKYDLDTTREATRRILANVTGGSESTLVEVRRGSGEDGSLILDAYVTVP